MYTCIYIYISIYSKAPISNLYYPRDDRNGLGLTFENAALGVAGTAIQNLFQEFFVKKLTPKRGVLGGGQ